MADRISLKCDACGKQLSVGADKAGRRVRCPCGEVVAVPKKASGEELARKWYYARQGERYGPVPQAELERLLAGGEVAAGDYVWTKGMAAWKAADEVEQFAGALAPPEEAVQAEPETPAAPADADAPAQDAPPKHQPEPTKPAEPEPAKQAAPPAKASPAPSEAAPSATKPAAPATEPAEVAAKPPEPAVAEPQTPPKAPAQPAAKPAEAVAKPPEPAVPKPQTPPKAPAQPTARPADEEPTGDHDVPEPKAPKARPVRQKLAVPGPAAQAPVAAIVVDTAPAYAGARAMVIILRLLGAVGFLGGAAWLAIELLRADTVSPGNGAYYLTVVVMMLGGLALVGMAQILALVRDAARGISQMAGSVHDPRGRPRR